MSDSKPQVYAEIIELDAGGEIKKSILEIDVKKDSQQLPPEKLGGTYADPRIAFSDLLKFYSSNIFHKRACNLKSVMIAGLGWDLVTEDENKDEDVDYKRIKAFLDNPNTHPSETFTEICYRAQIDYQAVGNLFLEAPRNLKGDPVELFHVRAKTMRRDRSLKRGYWQLQRGKSQEFRAWGQAPTNPIKNEILHYYAYDPEDSHYGIGEWYPALAEMILDRNVVEYGINLFLNQLMAKFIIIVEGGQLSTSAKASLKDYLSNNFHGVKNAGRTIILASDDPNVKIRIEKLEISFGEKSDPQTGTRSVSRDNVMAAHGIPPRLLSVIVASQLGGGNENEGQLKIFKNTVIDPEQSRFEEFLNNTLIKAFGEHKWKLKFNEFDVTNLESLSKALGDLVTHDIYDTDEAREELGKQPREGADIGKLTNQLKSIRKSLEAELE
ncbi:MAG: phage portal protein [Balneola sp.]